MRLEIGFPDGRTETRDFERDSVRIGGGEDVEIRLPDLPPLMAIIRTRGEKCVVQPTENSQVIVNGKRLILPKLIAPQDEIRLSDYTIRVLGDENSGAPGEPEEVDGEPEEKTPPAPEITQATMEDSAPTEFLELPPEIIPRLQVTGGPDQGKTFEILGTAVLGRDPSTDFALTDKFVSRHHIRFYLDEDGSVVAEDIGGKNPILVNGRVSPKKVLSHGDVIRVGKTELLFIYEAQGFKDEDEAPPGKWKKFLWAGAGGVVGLAIIVGAIAFFVARNSTKAKKQRAHVLMIQADAAPGVSDKARLYGQAAALLGEVVDRNPKDQEAVEGLRLASANQRLWEHISQAESMQAAGDYRAAIAEADAALKEDPDNLRASKIKEDATAKLLATTYEQEARSALARGDPGSGLVYAEMALEAYPWDEGLKALKDSCLAVLGKSAPSGQAALLSKLRKTHYKDKDPRKTLELAEAILSQDPEDPGALYYKTIAQMELKALAAEGEGKRDEATDLWRRIARIEPANPLAARRLK